MKLDAALDEYELLQRRRHRGEDRHQTGLALASLREYLLVYAGYEETGEVQPGDLFQFLLEYYPSQEAPEVEVAAALLDAAEGFSLWLLERGERQTAPFAAAGERLREDFPRTIEAYAILKEHTGRDRLSTGLTVEEENGRQEMGMVSSGLDQIARLDEIDYAASDEDYFTVREAGPGFAVLQSAGREALGEEPVRLRAPEPATERLRAGDILHGEIAPGPDGWELLEVFGIRPGGY